MRYYLRTAAGPPAISRCWPACRSRLRSDTTITPAALQTVRCCKLRSGEAAERLRDPPASSGVAGGAPLTAASARSRSAGGALVNRVTG